MSKENLSNDSTSQESKNKVVDGQKKSKRKNVFDLLVKIKNPLEVFKLIFETTLLISIFFAYDRFSTEYKIYRKNITIEEINSLKEREFLESIIKINAVASRLNGADFNCDIVTNLYHQKNCDMAKIEVVLDLNYVLNKYNKISLYYRNNIFDKNVISNSIRAEANEFNVIMEELSPVLDRISPTFKTSAALKDFRIFLDELNN